MTSEAADAGPLDKPGRKILVDIRRVTKRFGNRAVLDDVTIGIERGEFFTIIGPSGSGKTTLLRILGGFETPDECEALRIGGADMREVPAHRRNVATVFQHYALFPHMSAGSNVEYGLKVRGVPKKERRARAQEARATCRMAEAYESSVGTLSGGERQRVALARAIVTRPAALLLDEPLGALDEKLRNEMQIELKDLQQRLGVTFVYITHNQDEALTMSDRIAILHDGLLEQVDTPPEVYERPATAFVAGFMGSTNSFPASLVKQESGLTSLAVGEKVLQGRWPVRGGVTAGSGVLLSVRPEHVYAFREKPAQPSIAVQSTKVLYRGAFRETTYTLEHGATVTVRSEIDDRPIDPGERAFLAIDPDRGVVFPA